MIITQQDLQCPEYKSSDIQFDAIHGFYNCSTCSHKWGHDENDPDYDDYLNDECACGGQMQWTDTDGGDPPIGPPGEYLRCAMCGYIDEESFRRDDEE